MPTATEIMAASQDRQIDPTEHTSACVGTRAWTRGTVLVVEDEKLIRQWLRWVLHSRGYEVVTAATTQEAEAAIRQLGAWHVDLVIVDTHLRSTSDGMAGYQMYQSWKRAYPMMRFLLMSDAAHDRELVPARDSSVQFLVKRFLIADLMDAVRR